MDDVAVLAARLQRLEDLEAIRATWLDYCHQLDVGDFEALGAVFTPDAALEMDGLGPGLDGRYESRRDIIERFYARTGRPTPESGLRHMTGHLSTNMQIELDGDEARTLAYFFEIVDDNLVLIGTYQHRLRRDPDRWRFAFLRIAVRYRGRLEVEGVTGQTLAEIVTRPV